MESTIKFGTDGWRSRMDTDFTTGNVRRVAAAIADYLISKKGDRIFIGYDGRRNSHEFAVACAEVIGGRGIECLLPQRAIPTPIAAFAAVNLSLSGAIMITASHNPAAYNGIKFIPYYGGPASTDITSAIEALVPERAPAFEPFESLRRNGVVSEWDPIGAYTDHVRGLLNVGADELKRMEIAVDSMHGATTGIIDRILEEMGVHVRTVSVGIDPLFGGIVPDPVPDHLARLKDVTLQGLPLGVALDGDGDRLAVVTEKGDFLMANQLLPLLYLHMMERKAMPGDAARTVATSHLTDRVAEGHGRKVIEVPVGFKYIGSLLREKKVIIGGEESGGISIVTHIPEKDAIASALFVIEAITMSGAPISKLIEDIYEKYGYLVSSRTDLTLDKSLPFKLREPDPDARINGKKIEAVNRLDGTKLILEDGSWLLLRKSGTENVVRIYAESSNSSDTEILLRYGKGLVLGSGSSS